MAKKKKKKKSRDLRGRYLYAITRADDVEPSYGDIGLDDGDVYTIEAPPLAAVVSDVPNEEMRPRRRKLQAHHQVQSEVMEEATILPMSFGVIAHADEGVSALLETHREALLEQIERVEGAVEFGLAVKWTVDDVFEYVVEESDELRQRRDELYADGREPTRREKIELGKTFEEIREQIRADRAEQVEAILEEWCREIIRDDCREDEEVMNLACLVDEAATEDFEDAIVDAAEPFGDEYAFRYNGPIAPYSFVDLELDV
jgi:hypothetical protein